MSASTPIRRGLAVAATTAAGAALALAGVVAVPANASSATYDHACSMGGDPIGTLAVTHTLPETVIYGGTINVKTGFTLPDAVRDAMYNGTVRSLEGPSTTRFKVLGQDSPLPGSVPSTPVTDTDPLALVVASSVTLPDIAPVGLGLAVTAGEGTAAPDLAATLALFNEGGTKLADTPLECTLTAEGDPAIGTVMIVKAPSKTAASVAYKAATRKAVGRVQVTSPSSVKPSGKVKIVLSRNGKVVQSKVVSLDKAGRAAASFAPVKKGKLAIKATYAGSEGFKASKGSAVKTFS